MSSARRKPGNSPFLTAILFLTLFVAGPVASQERPINGLPGNVRMVAATGNGICEAVSVQSGVLAIGSGAAVEYWDVSTPSTPVRLGSLYLHGRVFFIRYEGALTYVGTYDSETESRLHVISSVDPANPVWVGGYLTQVRRLFNQGWSKFGNHFYISDFNGTDIVDVSIATAPVKVGTMTADANGIAGFGSLLYVIDNQSFRVMDNTTPAAPTTIGSLLFTFTQNDIAASPDGQHVYLVSEELKIIDVSTPATPVQVGAFNVGEFRFFPTLCVAGSVVYASDFSGIVYIIDVSNPANPTGIGQFTTGLFEWPDVAIDTTNTGQVYVSVGTGALGIDLTTPAVPAEGPFMHTGYFTVDLVVQDPLAPVPSPASGLASATVTASEGKGGTYQFDFDGAKGTTVVKKKYEKKYKSTRSNESLGWLGSAVYMLGYNNEADVVDFTTDPPSKIGGFSYLGSGIDIGIEQGFAYIAQGGNGVSVVDVTDQANPTVTTTLNAGSDAWKVDLGNLSLVVARGFQTERISLWSLVNPAMPTYTGGSTEGLNIQTAKKLGDILFAADSGQNLYSFDISNTATPTLTGTLDIGFFGGIMDLGGSFSGFRSAEAGSGSGVAGPAQTYVYIATGSLGLIVVDATDPAAMKIIGSYNTAEWTMSVEYFNGLLYVGDAFGGANVLELTPPTAILISNFEADITSSGTRMRWMITADEAIAGFDIQREEKGVSGQRSILDGTLLGSGVREHVDTGADPGRTYTYRLAAVRPDGSHVWSTPVRVSVPSRPNRLLGSYPNPFNPSATISFELARQERVTVTVFNAAGHRVAVIGDRMYPAGVGEVEWNGRNAAGERVGSGVYMYTVRIGKQLFNGKMVMLK